MNQARACLAATDNNAKIHVAINTCDCWCVSVEPLQWTALAIDSSSCSCCHCQLSFQSFKNDEAVFFFHKHFFHSSFFDFSIFSQNYFSQKIFFENSQKAVVLCKQKKRGGWEMESHVSYEVNNNNHNNNNNQEAKSFLTSLNVGDYPISSSSSFLSQHHRSKRRRRRTTTSVASHPHQCSTPIPCRHDFPRLRPRHPLQLRTTRSSTSSLRGGAGQCAAAEGIDKHPLSALHHYCRYCHHHQKKTTKRISFHRGATHETTSPSSQLSKDMRCC